ncbi:T9SS type A sorting domain-containing protein [uncultured Polaribacter sp.]|uniref:T9SS type A sorting domain-containing protein n=1 Tax=uncultured Polaribacter sp. TaxID=174711 RepID=UPI00262D8B39|nr:T9SS type A sorting domain-containing protein [uncultured Polaribacter sp.]
MMKKNLYFFSFFVVFNFVAQQNTVTVFPEIKRFIGTVSELQRDKFFNIHYNEDGAEENIFYNQFNVTRGRGFWGPFSYANFKMGEVGVYPEHNNGNTSVRQVSRFIGTEHPRNVFKDGIDINIAADWAVEYFKNFVDVAERPKYYEMMNEPFVKSGDFYSGNFDADKEDAIRTQMANMFRAVGQKIQETPELSNIKVIGYAGAYPEFERKDFEQWDKNMKLFIDIAGNYMDALSVHLYDGINVTGQNSIRSGSNSEAILDLMETYTYSKWGSPKLLAISEYGGIEQGYGDDYSDIANAQSLKSMNHMMFNFLDRTENIEIVIPFTTGKAAWHITPENNYQPYSAVLWKPTNIGQPNPNGWEYTPRIYFYDLWKNVKGERVVIKTSNPDIQVQAFKNTNKLYLALSNLARSFQIVDLEFSSILTNLDHVNIKRLKIYDNNEPQFSNSIQNNAPSFLSLIADETVVLEYAFSSNLPTNNTSRAVKYYTAKHLQTIIANQTLDFSFSNVHKTNVEFATLRFGLAREHNRSKQPILIFNGTQIAVPTNWKGYDQANRESFFGVIDIDIPKNLVKNQNTVAVTFPDGGGRVSSMILSVENFDTVLSLPSTIDEELSLQIMPNPVTDFLKIKYNNLDGNKANLKIFDLKGSCIHHQKVNLNNNETIIDVKNLSKGMYILNLELSDRVVKPYKFIKR